MGSNSDTVLWFYKNTNGTQTGGPVGAEEIASLLTKERLSLIDFARPAIPGGSWQRILELPELHSMQARTTQNFRVVVNENPRIRHTGPQAPDESTKKPQAEAKRQLRDDTHVYLGRSRWAWVALASAIAFSMGMATHDWSNVPTSQMIIRAPIYLLGCILFFSILTMEIVICYSVALLAAALAAAMTYFGTLYVVKLGWGIPIGESGQWSLLFTILFLFAMFFVPYTIFGITKKAMEKLAILRMRCSECGSSGTIVIEEVERDYVGTQWKTFEEGFNVAQRAFGLTKGAQPGSPIPVEVYSVTYRDSCRNCGAIAFRTVKEEAAT